MQSNKALYVVLTAIFLLLCMVALLSGKSSSVAMEGEPSREVQELHELHELPSADMGLASSPKTLKREDMSLDDVVYELSELGESVSDLHTKSIKFSPVKRVDTHVAEKRAYRKKMRRMRRRRMRHEAK